MLLLFLVKDIEKYFDIDITLRFCFCMVLICMQEMLYNWRYNLQWYYLWGENIIIYIDKTHSLEIACSSQQTLVDVLDSMYKYGLYICPSYITSQHETSINGNPLVTTQNILWGGESSL